MSTLTICKASAGSGKTHKLTGEYLKLVFDPKIKFRNVLAVTFTNKATAEMRERILKAISDIANGHESDYIKELCQTIEKITADELRNRAQTLLKQILNQYSYFKISTIDSFFQQVIKSIAYELDLDSGFTLELDDKSVTDNAVSRMIDDFGVKSDEGQWIMQTIGEKMEKGNRWEIQSETSNFAVKAFDKVKDKNKDKDIKQIISELGDFKNKLRQIRDGYLTKANTIGKKAVAAMEKAGLTSNDFSYKDQGTVWKYFVVCAAAQNVVETQYGNRVVTQRDDIDKMIKDKALQGRFIQAGLPEMLQQLTDLADSDDFNAALSSDLTLANINKLVLAYRVLQLQKDICNEQNLFLLRSTMPFLNKMIGNSDAPFIYEKFGYTLNHFMIDEFQDTSTMNWQNFLPLIWNKVAEGLPSLIVGDVKQAIYRWRGGDWNLLDNQVQNEFDIAPSDIENLEYNWRSCKNVVLFNNWCVKAISNMMGKFIGEMVDAGCYKPEYLDIFNRTYSDAVQKVPEKNANTEGFVSVDYIDVSDVDTDEATGEWVVNQLDRLAELGYQPGDIAILVRSKKNGAAVANCLAKAQGDNPELASRYRFVSSESILLGNNQAIRLLVSAMQFLLTPEVTYVQAQLVWLYHAINSGLKAAAERIQQTVFDKEATSVWAQMPTEFASLKNSFRQLDLIQLSSRLTQVFFGLPHQISATDRPFINEFEDRVQTFSERNGSNLQLFIDWWNDKGFQQTITMNDRQNAIQIMTIHKAKGLEFKAVLLPYPSPADPRGTDIIWCETDAEPYKDFSPIPVGYKQELAQSVFAESYYKEQFMRHIDNLNVLYVALTRASRDMRICVTHENEKVGDIFTDKKIWLKLRDFAQTDTSAAEKGIVCDDDRITIGVEQPYKSKIEADNTTEEVTRQCPTTRARVDIRCHSKDFFAGVDFDRVQNINTGKLYHHIFEYIKYADDVADAVREVVNEGYIEADKAETYERAVAKFIAKQPDWFSRKWKVFTEQSIMLADGENRIRRPDRILESDNEVIVIDYKFTSHHNPDYNQQVGVYVDALRELTGKKVTGYLWYVWPNEKVEVVTD
ncbi:MAG: UvrD-helicase domain-containing protein [Salinivirgaceae bacterium]|nr:UvrD-helicase domain-containing protein [Salinivirgaceae bacterium]